MGKKKESTELLSEVVQVRLSKKDLDRLLDKFGDEWGVVSAGIRDLIKRFLDLTGVE